MREIFLVRHGETEWNVARRMQGSLDSPLTALGRDQAGLVGRRLAMALAGRRDIAFQVSPLPRTRATAAIIAGHAELPEPVIEPRIQEINCGQWEGLTREEILARWPERLEGRTDRDWIFNAPGGESLDRMAARLGAWLAEPGPVVAVSHGMAGKIIRGLYLGLAVDAMLDLPTPQDVIWHLKEGTVREIGG